MNSLYRLAVIIFTLMTSVTIGKAQSADPAGYVLKYDTNFKGIGPEVYFLPAPRTKEEILVDLYKEKENFGDSISRALDFQLLLAEFKFTGNSGHIKQFYRPFPQNSEDWNTLINQVQRAGNIILASGLLNEYAWESLQNKNINQTIGLLIGALENVRRISSDTEMAVIQSNLVNVYLFNRNFTEAAVLQEQYLAKATSNKSIVEQANSWVKIAKVQAHRQDYKLAESSIIRKAIPLYNRARDYAMKVVAWQQLANIYQMHNKHTEAQWFLIQARDLAAERGVHGEAAEIEYMLASSKMAQKNYKVAIKEFENAKKLAKKENNELLELAIHNKLGEAHIALANYDEAENELEHYWELRKKLF